MCAQERFVSKYISTVGVDYGVKTVDVDGNEVRVNFWDLSGQPEFFDVRNEFYKETTGAMLTFDVSSRKSFEALDSWYSESKRFGCTEKTAHFVVVANKCDLKRAVSQHEGEAWARDRGLAYFETSANTGVGVVDMFESLFQHVLRKHL